MCFLCSSQINIVLKLTHLPALPSYTLDLCEFPLNYASQRFYMMQGIVIAMTTITKYTQGARFLCSDGVCPLSKGQCSNGKLKNQAVFISNHIYNWWLIKHLLVSPNIYQSTVHNLETIFAALHRFISVGVVLEKDISNETERNEICLLMQFPLCLRSNLASRFSIDSQGWI